MNVQEEIQGLRDNVISQRSRSVYTNSTVKFVEWLLEHKPELITEEFKEKLNQLPAESSTYVKGKKVLEEHSDCLPIHLTNMGTDVFLSWILSLKKRDGMKPSFTVYNTHRSALCNLYRKASMSMPDRMEKELRVIYKGLRRRTVTETSQGRSEVRTGKNPLSFSLYRFLALHLSIASSTDAVFGKFFLTLCWNLMARASNCFNILHPHMEWRSDALCKTEPSVREQLREMD